MNRNQLISRNNGLTFKLVELLKHTDVDGKKLAWNLQVNATAVTVKLTWIKAAKPIATIGEVTSQAPKKKHLSPSTRKRNAQRLNQWKATRNQAVVNTKVHAETQTDNRNNQIDETTQTDQQNSHDLEHNTPPRVIQKRERSTQSRSHIKGRPVTSTKYPWKNAHRYEVRTCQVSYATRWNLKTDQCLTRRHSIQMIQH